MKPTNVDEARLQRKKMLNKQNILNKNQKEEIKKAFDFFDITGSGLISITLF
jgi:Ca2+-binding EF-hand superfamily protein